MVPKGKSSVEVQKNFEGFIAVLTLTACEWFLIFLLFVNALLSYLLAKVALYCDLQKPCILCSRFEHIVGNESCQLYEDLLCSNHTLKLASWLASQIYGKDDGSGMHEDYHSPSNREMHVFSVGNSVSDVKSSGFRRHVFSRSRGHSPAYSPVHSPVGVGQWSHCCSPWGRGNIKGGKPKSSVTKHAKPNIPLPRMPNRGRPNRSRDNSRKIRDKSPASVTSRRSAKVGYDSLSNVGYSELKFNSDNDSEFMFSDWDDASNASSVNDDYMKEGSARASRYRPKVPSHGMKSGRHRNRSSKPKRSLSEPWPVFTKAADVKFDSSLGELCYQQSSRKSNSSASPELISLDDILPSPNVLENDVNGTCNFGDAPINKNVELLKPVCAKDEAFVKNDPALTKSVHNNVIAVSESEGSVGEKDSSGITREALIKPDYRDVNAISESEGIVRKRDPFGITTEALMKPPDHSEVNVVSQSQGHVKERDSPGITTEAHIEPVHSKVNALSHLDRSIEERNASGVSIGQKIVKKPDRVDENMNLLAQQGSSAQGIMFSPENTSLTVDGCVGEKQTTYASSSSAKPVLNTSTSVESGIESLDGGYVTEIEGESILDRLKRQVEYDRNYIKELCKELEEERNAAAISANQAMAMITKLQEEKAAFQMEAFHYLRMMEEQAEFDDDALQKANDLLAEKEKEIQDLEAELDSFKLDFQDQSLTEYVLHKGSDFTGGIDPVETTVMPSVKNDLNGTCDPMATEANGSNQPLFSEATLLEFEDEKLYITNCLKSLERKLSELSAKSDSSKMPDGNNQAEAPRKEGSLLSDGQHQEETSRKEMSLLNDGQSQEGKILSNGQLEEDVLHGGKDMSNGSSAAQEGPTDCHGGDDPECGENNDSGSRWEKDIMDRTEMDLVCLEHEISDLNDRLEALETDHDFLEHMLYSLQNGREGLQFVREIAQQLQELRKIGMGFR